MTETQSTQQAPNLDTPLWQFALSLWQRDDARELCLALQQQGWSVTRLLCAGWLASQGQPYSGAEPETVMQWRENVTESIRSLKKSLSKSDSLLAPLRESLARAELEAERIELYQAWQALRDIGPEHNSVDRGAITELNLQHAAPAHLGSLNETTGPMIRHLAQCILANSNGRSGQPEGQRV